MLPPDFEVSHTASIEQRDGDVEVTLRDSAGATLASKAFAARPSCGEMAEILAVVLAAWEAEFSERVPETPTAGPTEIKEPAPPEGNPESRPRVRGLEMGISFSVLKTLGAQWGTEIAVNFSYLPVGSRWGVDFYGMTGAYGATGIHLGVGLGPRFRIIDSAIRLDANAALLATSLALSNYGEAARAEFHTGAMVGLRAQFGAGIWKPSVGLIATAWPMSHDDALPVFNFGLTVGSSWGAP